MKEFPKHPMRTRFGDEKEIVCEFLPPRKKSNRVLILCAGMPSYPGGGGGAIRALADKGYWVLVPRYRGSWESDGVFLARSPHEDVLAVVKGVQHEFIEVTTGVPYTIERPKIYLIGASFGGAAALLASRDARVTKVATLSSVVDWTQQAGTREPLNDASEKAITAAWGNGYRHEKDAYKKLAAGNFYNPVREMVSLQGKKILMLHTKDDTTVPYAPTRAFAKNVGATFFLLRTGGHFGVSSVLKPHLWKRVEKFFKTT